MRITDKNWFGNYTLSFAYIELYGALINQWACNCFFFNLPFTYKSNIFNRDYYFDWLNPKADNLTPLWQISIRIVIITSINTIMYDCGKISLDLPKNTIYYNFKVFFFRNKYKYFYISFISKSPNPKKYKFKNKKDIKIILIIFISFLS